MTDPAKAVLPKRAAPWTLAAFWKWIGETNVPTDSTIIISPAQVGDVMQWPGVSCDPLKGRIFVGPYMIEVSPAEGA